MAAELFSPPSKALDPNANPYSGAQWKFYVTGGLVPLNVYADAALSTSLGAVVTADSAGKFANIYFDASETYRGICTDSAGAVTLHDIDPINTNLFSDLLANLASSAGAGMSGASHDATYAQGTIGARWAQRVNIQDDPFLADAAQSADASGKIGLAWVEAAGRPVEIGVGQFRLDTTQTLTPSGSIKGSGWGVGPGTFSSNATTQLIANFDNGDLLTFDTSLYGVEVENLQINAYSQHLSGAAIHLQGTASVANGTPPTVSGSTVGGYSLKKIAFNDQATCIRIDDPGHGWIEQIYAQNWKNHAIYLTGKQSYNYLGTTYGVEPECGWIRDVKLRGDAATIGTTQATCIRMDGGYGKVIDAHCLGAQVAIWVEIKHFPGGNVDIDGGTFEEQDIAGIYITDDNSGQPLAMLSITRAEFSTGLATGPRTNWQGHIVLQPSTAGDWLRQVQILGTRHRSTVPQGFFMDIGTGQDVTIANNSLFGLAGNAATGIRVQSGAKNVILFNNVITGTFTTKYALTTECMLFDYRSGLTVAEVNAITCADGSQVKVVDGDPTIPGALTGGGAGCMAERVGGAWYPKFDLSNAPTGYGTPTGGALLANFPGATATLPQVTGAFAQLLLHLMSQGLLKA